MLQTDWITVGTIALTGAAVPPWVAFLAKMVRKPVAKRTETLLFAGGMSWISFVTLSVAALSDGQLLPLVCGTIGLLAMAVAWLAWKATTLK